MKKLLGIVVLGLLLSVNVHAEASEITIDELFGVKILDNIDKYANKADGVEQDHLKDIITFGPGNIESGVHGPNECIDIEKLINCTKIYALTILELDNQLYN